ncbi:MAG: hypothetical protein JWM09_591 [Francisellaceae bacterium]|nr:hypothetical protein [Francisellaceae bacterium]
MDKVKSWREMKAVVEAAWNVPELIEEENCMVM